MIGIVKNNLEIQAKDIMAVKNINRLSDNNVNSCLFCNFVPNTFPLEVNTTILQKAQVLDFDGTILTDDLVIAQEFLHLPYAKKRFLYLYDLDWPYIDNFSFAHIGPIIHNDRIELIVRSHFHYDLVKNLFKKPSYIMEEWDHKTLKEIDQDAQ